MKIIDNPTLGIVFLLCVGLVVLGFSLLPTAEGQQHGYQNSAMVTSDERPDEIVFGRTERSPVRSRLAVDQRRDRRPHDAPPDDAQRSAFDLAGHGGRRPVSSMEKRDELLHRIVQLRLERGEFEKLPPVVLQMQRPETAIETMLDFAEQSDDEKIGLLLDMTTALTVQMGQPKPPVPAEQHTHLYGHITRQPGQPAHVANEALPNGSNITVFSQGSDPHATYFSSFVQFQGESNTPLPLGTVSENMLPSQPSAMNADVIAGPVSPQIITAIEGTGTAENISQDENKAQEQPAP